VGHSTGTTANAWIAALLVLSHRNTPCEAPGNVRWVRLGQCANVMVGVAVDSCMLLDTHAEQRAWFYYCSTGHKYQAGQVRSDGSLRRLIVDAAEFSIWR
jgi:hypothetical protein